MAGEVSNERRQVAWIGQHVTIEGKITSSQDIRIDGSVQGTIDVSGHEVVLGAGSEVKANLSARAVIVGGTVNGDVIATERIEIQSAGVLQGDIVAPRLVVRDGGLLRGKADIAGSRKND